jgi:hypothetical protein
LISLNIFDLCLRTQVYTLASAPARYFTPPAIWTASVQRTSGLPIG